MSDMLGKVANAKVFDIPVGAAGVALAAGGVGDIISGFAAGAFPTSIVGNKYFPAAVKLGLAYATNKWGKKVLGQQAASLAALMFTVGAVQDVVDIRGWISGLFTPTTPTPAAARARVVQATPDQSFRKQIKLPTATTPKRLAGGKIDYEESY